MATPPTEPKSTPDIQRLQSMGSRTLTVQKLLSRTGAGMPIPPYIGKRGVSVEDITSLHTSLPTTPGAGPGTYKFEVFDETGPEKDVWTAKLGPDIPEVPVADFPGPGGGPGAAVPRHLGGGWFYDDTTGLLISPTKQAMPWKPGEPFPGQIPNPAAAAAVPPQTWTPWGPAPAGASGMPPWGWGGGGGLGWGQIPATGGDDDTKREVRELKAQLETRNREDAHKAEMAVLAKSVEEQGKRFEVLFAKLGEKPSGPSPEVAALTASLEELKRQNAEQRSTMEATRREDTLRAEIKAQGDRFEALSRDMKDSKQDPMIPMITQMMSTMQASTTSMIGAMATTAQTQATSAENGMRELATRLGTSAMTPERVLELLRVAKDQGPADALHKGALEMYRNLFSMSQEVLRTQAEMNSSSNGPAWLPPVQQGIDQIGAIARAVAEKRAGADAATEVEKQRTARATVEERVAAEKRRTAEAEAATAQANARVRMAAAPAAPGAPPRAPDPVAAARAAGRQPTAAEMRDSAANTVFGAPKPAGNGAAAPPAPAPVPAVAPAAPAQAAAPTAAAPARGKRAPSITSTSADEIRASIADKSDEWLFGPALSQIVKLRGAAENGMPPDEAAEAILMSRQYFRAFGEIPPALELLNAGQIEVLVERVFPGDGPVANFRRQVADQIRVKARAEAAEGGGDGGEDESTEEASLS